MNWNKIFEKIYVINLPERTDRLQQATEELNGQGIPFEVFPAIKHNNGRLGIYLTLYMLIEQCFDNDVQTVLIFEDDVKFIANVEAWFCNDSMSKFYWNNNSMAGIDILYFGCNTHDPNDNIIPLEYANPGWCKVLNVFSCHAMAFSQFGMKMLLSAVEKDCTYKITEAGVMEKVIKYHNPIDVLIRDKIQPLGRCYCTNPMLATQRNSYSDIEGKEVNQDYLLERFEANIKLLNEKK